MHEVMCRIEYFLILKSKKLKKISDEKTIDWKIWLTDSLILKLTTYDGNAIRDNSKSVCEMK